jgi:hypothetical protein
VRILTVKPSWSHAIIHLGKDVENRSWSTLHRGTIAIHAGLGADESVHLEGAPPFTLIDRGVIVGVVDLVNVVLDSTSRWAEPDQFHWLLANPRPITPIPYQGGLGLRHLDADVAAQIMRQLGKAPA